MAKSKVAILKTSPATVLRDYHSVMNLAGYQEVVQKDADTALKVNIADLAKADAGVMRDAEQHLGVVGEKRPPGRSVPRHT